MRKEIELKYVLSKKEDFFLFERFLEQYRCDKKHSFMQKNFYFDSRGLELRRAGLSLRLRQQNNDYILSAKHSLSKKHHKHKHLSIRLEYEGPVDKRIAMLILNHHLSALDAFLFLRSRTSDEESTKKTLYQQIKKATEAGLQIIGSFTNQRTAVPIILLGHKLVIELDHMRLPKGVEIFEVEVELSGVRQVALFKPSIEKLFRTAGLRTYKSSSKSSRLYKILFG